MKRTPLELQRFTDGVYVIVGGHLSIEEAKEKFEKEYDAEMDAVDDDTGAPIYCPIKTVKNCWIRYEFIGPYNYPDDMDDCEPGTACWLLYPQEKRPRGVVRKVTVINYER